MSDLQDDLNFGVDIQEDAKKTNNKKQSNPTNINPIGSEQNANQNQKSNIMNFYNLSQASHPIACIFTFLFKLTAFITYFFVGYEIPSVTTFIIVVVLTGCDFWVVKNITGRLLVGLRWWSDFDEDGKQIWIYQSYDTQYTPNAVDSGFFWTSQIGFSLLWAIFLIINVISADFFWALLVAINLCLCGTNLYGYYKCRGEHSKKLNELKKNLGQQGVMYMAQKFI